jgi:predicted GTPase
MDRAYDFSGVVEWFSERADRILLLFDAHKLDISDEFRSSIEAMRGHEDKIRIVLNKADMVDHQVSIKNQSLLFIVQSKAP